MEILLVLVVIILLIIENYLADLLKKRYGIFHCLGLVVQFLLLLIMLNDGLLDHDC